MIKYWWREIHSLENEKPREAHLIMTAMGKYGLNLLSNIHDSIDDLKSAGFINIGGDILSASEVRQLRDLSGELLLQFEQETRTATAPTDFKRTGVGEGAWALTRLSQHHPAISQTIDKVVSDKNVKTILKSILGTNYKIWEISLRRSSPGDTGLYLHQDALGQINLVILLTDNLAGDGATSFLPKSHLVAKTAKSLRVEAPPVLLNFMRGLLKPFTGRAGDIGFFFNRTWHGRFSNQSTKSHDVILIAFFPSGATFGFGGSYLEPSQKYLSEIKGTELSRLLDPGYGTELVADKLYKVASDGGNTEAPFSLQIADPVGHNLKTAGWRAYVVILLLRIIMPLGRIARRGMASNRVDTK
ncbi:MAG: phytanoyl-CoA dioxygenase family protein [Nitrosomonadaceae bacterium]|nr:phytanoyl-CoA dioxygenase family protein [Nitrosomonadaceae bacterium]